MKRLLTIFTGLALAGLLLLMLPYLLLAGIFALLLFRLIFRHPAQIKKRFNVNAGSAGSNPQQRFRYHQAYARHWQGMTQEERDAFLSRNAPVE
jgi:hypothetical protein